MLAPLPIRPWPLVWCLHVCDSGHSQMDSPGQESIGNKTVMAYTTTPAPAVSVQVHFVRILFRFICKVCAWMYVGMCICAHGSADTGFWWRQRPEEPEPPGAQVTGGNELPRVGAGN